MQANIRYTSGATEKTERKKLKKEKRRELKRLKTRGDIGKENS